MANNEKPIPEDDDFQFGNEPDETIHTYSSSLVDSYPRPWKICIADDEEEIHTMTKLVLRDIAFQNRSLQIFDTYSGEETKRLLYEHPDIALILLDVVMESDDAGLKAIRYIRNYLKNHLVRIILRTGQPGKAPEKKVVLEYDINDYKEKTELTVQKLYTTIISSLRAYNDLRRIEKNKRGLEQIIQASAFLIENQSLRKFAEGILAQLLSILNLDETSLFVQKEGFAATESSTGLMVLAATGRYQNIVDANIEKELDPLVRRNIELALRNKQNLFIDDAFVGYFQTKNGSKNILYISGVKNLPEDDISLIDIFCNNVAIAYENIYLNMDLIDTQKEMLLKIGDVIETRSKETANHVHRVAEFSYLIACGAGIPINDAILLRHASPMHDIGKVGIPDTILMKPEKLTSEEHDIIKQHTLIGYNILNTTNRSIVRAAAIIAHEHHERWDGLGYPQGLKENQIHIFGRITAIADVFDALMHKREYKEAWDSERVFNLFREERGKQFDPFLVDIFFKKAENILKINNRFPDTFLVHKV